MKKIISFALVTVAILTPNMALSSEIEDFKEDLLEFSEEEVNIFNALLCSYEDSSKVELMAEIANINSKLSDEQQEELAEAVIEAEELPKKFEKKSCKP